MTILDYVVGGVRRLPYYSTRPLELASTLSRHWYRWREAERGAPADCAFLVSGGLGDKIVAARYVRDLIEHCGPMTFDTYGSKPGAIEFAFDGIEGLRDCFSHEDFFRTRRQYLAVFDVTDFVWMRSLSPLFATDARQRELIEKLRGIGRSIEAFTHPINNFANMVRNHPHLDNLLAQTSVAKGYNRHNFCHALSGIPYGGHSLDIPLKDDALRCFGLADRPYITIADGYDREFEGIDAEAPRSTKSYPHYGALVANLKRLFPDLYVVQVGKGPSLPIAGTDKLLVDKTSLPELASVLAASRFHIDNEGGLVHLATTLGTPCCVVFGPTNLAYFSYDENINVRPVTCGNCYWITDDWMTRCPRGDDIPVCTREISPDTVCKLIAPTIERAIRAPQTSMA